MAFSSGLNPSLPTYRSVVTCDTRGNTPAEALRSSAMSKELPVLVRLRPTISSTFASEELIKRSLASASADGSMVQWQANAMEIEATIPVK